MRIHVPLRPEQRGLLQRIQREIDAAKARYELAVEAMLTGVLEGGDIVGLSDDGLLVEVADAPLS